MTKSKFSTYNISQCDLEYFCIPNVRTNFILYRVVKVWNMLLIMKEIDSVERFRSNLGNINFS